MRRNRVLYKWGNWQKLYRVCDRERMKDKDAVKQSENDCVILWNLQHKKYENLGPVYNFCMIWYTKTGEGEIKGLSKITSIHFSIESRLQSISCAASTFGSHGGREIEKRESHAVWWGRCRQDIQRSASTDDHRSLCPNAFKSVQKVIMKVD